ncbi:MucR family transcriptional regulator [Rhizobium sp. MHM7A]|uniref:MucR family transcriptional regulator n=1 Tax=Rhizobium sp. MHM7A TaxID=2583233 RepID=UPI001105AFEF|nr:MucR family transcriptional regulator [Rhizobium sp. MHM7A]TLX17004.1 transcriptional regulator [Rhizobium sp. MHM7A]
MSETIETQDKGGLVVLTSDIVSAYVTNHVVPQSELAELIASVHGALLRTTDSPVKVEEKVEPRKPAVSIKKSVTNEEITCLECGKAFKSLKRHLATHHSVTPEEYKAEWSLPSDYPMVAPSYAEKRSALARESGLGQTRRRASQRKAA